MNNYRAQIQYAILKKISRLRHIHKRNVKSIIDEIKQQYIYNPGMTPNELLSITDYFKKHWQELKEMAKNIRRSGEITNSAIYSF